MSVDDLDRFNWTKENEPKCNNCSEILILGWVSFLFIINDDCSQQHDHDDNHKFLVFRFSSYNITDEIIVYKQIKK